MIKYNKDNLFLITGASSGLGQSTALLLNELGASVVAIGRNKERLQEVKSLSKNSDIFHIEQKDLTDDINNLHKWIHGLADKYGKFDGFVHSAGLVKILPAKNQDLEDMKEIFDINVFSSIALLKGITHKKTRKEKFSGVYLSSLAGMNGITGMTLYSATKGSIIALVKSAAAELARYGIRINSLVPGDIATTMQSESTDMRSEEYIHNVINRYPLGLGEPLDIANFACFLLSDKSKWITGQNYVLDGGIGFLDGGISFGK